MKKYLGIAAVVLSFLFCQNVFAHSDHCGKNLKIIVTSLKLDDAQKEKIKPILEKLKTDMSAYHGQMRDLEKEFATQEDAATTDQSALDSLVDKKVKIIGDMIKAKLNAKAQIAAILTAEQKTQLREKMKKAEEKMAEAFKDCHDE